MKESVERPRALVTGIGILSPLGRGRRAILDGVREGRSGIREITAFDTSPFRTPFGGEIREFDPTWRLSPEEIELYPDTNIQFALTAARDALEDAGIDAAQIGPRFGLVVGTCNGGLRIAEWQYRIILGHSAGRFDRKMSTLIRYHTLGKAMACGLRIEGPVWITATACSSSTGALGLALELIELGVVDRLLVGGSDALCLSTMAGFDAIRATSTGKTAPFSLPTGLNLGEGAAFWMVETEASAAARGKSPMGEILGYALTADAYHPTAPDPRGDGAFRTMEGALTRSGIQLDDLGCINAHGTGTDANDRVESKAVGRFIGDKPIPVYSFKSQVGHCLGAAGIIEATAGLTAMQNNLIPPTVNFTESRPGCQLDYVPNKPRSASYDSFVSCNYAFGGNNAGVVIAKPHRYKKGIFVPERAVITGCGMITSLGIGTEANLEALRQERRGLVSVASRVDEPCTASLAGLVPEFDPKEVDRRLDFRDMNPISRFATVAARAALLDAGLRIGPKEGRETGVVNGVFVGPSEEVYMKTVIGTAGSEADIGGFSQIVANSTAGWVSSALQLKGYGTTVAQGADAGLFALAAASYAIRSGSAVRISAGAADELYSRYFINYDDTGCLRTHAQEAAYGINMDTFHRRVLGEGAAYVMVESLAAARARSAPVLAEILAHGMTTDYDEFYDPCLKPDRLAAAIEGALRGAGWTSADVGAVVWSPQGNKDDDRKLAAMAGVLGARFDEIPLITTVFNTGLMESVSGTATLGAVLSCWKHGLPLWPSMTGDSSIDRRPLPESPVNLLVIASGDIGYNLATAVAPRIGETP